MVSVAYDPRQNNPKRKNPLHDPRYQRALRLLRQARGKLRDVLQSPKERLRKRGQAFKKAFAEVKREQQRLAQELYEGNTHAVRLTDLRQQTSEMARLLEQVTSTERVQIRRRVPDSVAKSGYRIVKETVTLREWADAQAFSLRCCSTKVVYRHYLRTDKWEFAHSLRCNRRWCPVCAHFRSLDVQDAIVAAIVDKLSAMSVEERKSGRLFHLVLTHENVPADRVLDIFKVWRTIQQLKKRVYKGQNVYSAWNLLQWGIWRFEFTRNEETGLYHPHLHILAWIPGWLASERGGWWEQLVRGWQHACEVHGLQAAWEAQYFGVVCYFSEHDKGDPRAISPDFTAEQINVVLRDSAAEMAKYVGKSTDFTNIKRVKAGENIAEIANELAKILYQLSGRKLINGFGGVRLRIQSEDEVVVDAPAEPLPADVEEVEEVIFTWDESSYTYQLYVRRKWNEERFRAYLRDLQDFRNRSAVYMYYGLEPE